MEPTCKDCKYWQERCKTAEYRYPGIKWGVCRKNPPKLNKIQRLFPEIDEDNWCGEWGSKP